MRFAPPSKTLLARSEAERSGGRLWCWLQMLHVAVQVCLDRWNLEWTGESLPQGSVSYVIPCRTESGVEIAFALLHF